MDRLVRSLYHDLVELINIYDSLPWEVRRVVIENVGYMVEKKADEAIRSEDIQVDTLDVGKEVEECKKPIAE